MTSLYLDGRRWEPLGGPFGVWVNSRFRFSTDALLLARFALDCAPRARRMADLGTGCGIIPLIWAQERPEARIVGIEYQNEGAELAVESALQSGVNDRVAICCGDLRQWTVPAAERFDVVACNPPYFAPQSGAPAVPPARRLARGEETCTIADAAAAAARLLTGTGWFCIVHRTERLCDVLAAMRAAGLEPKRLQLVQADRAHAPKLFLAAGRRGGRPGMTVLPVRLLRTEPVTYA